MMSQNWRTNYLLPCRGCLNVHEKKMEKMFPTKNILFVLLLLTVIQCKQRYIRTSLPCRYRSGFKIFFSISKASKFSIMQD
jgi:hypothetical protein